MDFFLVGMDAIRSAALNLDQVSPGQETKMRNSDATSRSLN